LLINDNNKEVGFKVEVYKVKKTNTNNKQWVVTIENLHALHMVGINYKEFAGIVDERQQVLGASRPIRLDYPSLKVA
jgi:hypothetical protein